MAAHNGNSEQFIFEIQGCPERLRVTSFTGIERVSAPFYFDIELAVKDTDLSLEALVGTPGLLTFLTESDDTARHVHGIVYSAGFVKQTNRYSVYRINLRPQFALLQLRKNCRIFQDLPVPKIIETVLSDSKLLPADQFSLKLNGKYEPREYCVQYRESDLDFISRLMEEEGIYYYFEHSAQSHIAILTDSNAAHNPINEPAEVIYRDTSGTVELEDCVRSFLFHEEVQTSVVATRDFNFKKPALNLEAIKQDGDNEVLELYDYPGGYSMPESGEKFAQVRLESLKAQRKQGIGSSNCLRFLPGYTFSLYDSPRDQLDQEYFITSVKSYGQQPQVIEEMAGQTGTRYHNEFQCIPSDVTFRTPQVTSRPQVNGVQTAIVTGPQGEEICVDEFGRVKVQFHWDRNGKNDEKSSCWIRVSQTMAGPTWGSMLIPRIGNEVIVDFVDGNPDRPIILGQVYHGTNRPPFSLPGSGMVSGMKSLSTPDGDGFNEISMNDTKGKENLNIHAQHNMSTTVQGSQTNTVNSKFTETIKSDATITISEGNLKYEITKGTAEFHIKGALTEKFESTQDTTVNKNITIKSTEGEITIIGKNAITLQSGESKITLNADGTISIVGLAVAITGKKETVIKGGTITSKADTENKMEGAAVLTDGSATNTVKGGMVMLNP